MRIGMMELLIVLLVVFFIAVGRFLIMRNLIKYNAKQKRIHSEQSELDKMKIDDLE